jgi:polyisoprenoid-binding protein YceI
MRQRRNAASILCSSLCAAGLAAAGFAAFNGASGTAHAEAIDMESRALAPVYTVDGGHSGVVFRVRHRGVTNFHGRFNKIDGSFSFDPENLAAASFKAEIPVDSVDTGIEKRDEHLRSADFFNARQYPVATFESTAVRATSTPNHFELDGTLTLHGETKPITATLEWIGTGEHRGKPLAGFEANFSIKRADFGITTYLAEDGGENGGLGNTVDITIFAEGVAE